VLTGPISPVGEIYAGDVERHQQIDRPPWVRYTRGSHTRPVDQVRAMSAVVSVIGVISEMCICVVAALVRQTIECNVHHLATIYCHCTTTTIMTSSYVCCVLCAQVAPSGECLRGKSPPDGMLAKPWRRLFLAAFGLNLVVVAVPRDRLL